MNIIKPTNYHFYYRACGGGTDCPGLIHDGGDDNVNADALMSH